MRDREREMFEEKGNITHHQQFVSKSHSLCVILLIKNQNIKTQIMPISTLERLKRKKNYSLT